MTTAIQALNRATHFASHPRVSGQNTKPMFYYSDPEPGESYPVSDRPYACEVTRGGITYYANNFTHELWTFEPVKKGPESNDDTAQRSRMSREELKDFQGIIRRESATPENRFFLESLTSEFDSLTIEYAQENRPCHMSPPTLGTFTRIAQNLGDVLG